MLKFLLPALTLAFAPIATSAGVVGPESYIQDDFDVAGVTLGMQPDTVRTELENRGYKILDDDFYTIKGPSFDELLLIVSGELDEDGGRDSWKEMTFKKGQNEGVSVRYKPLPTGSAAYEIYYYNMSSAMTKERFMAAAESKYGRPRYVANSGGEAIWSDMKLVNGTSVDQNVGAIELVAADGPPHNGNNAFQGVKGSLKLFRGKVGDADAEEMANTWSPPAETTF